MFEYLFNLSNRWAKLVLIGTIVALGIVGYYGVGVFSDLTSEDGFIIPGTESAEVIDIISDNFSKSQPSGIILFESKDENILATDPKFEAQVQKILDSISPQPTQIASYYSTQNEQFLSKDRTKTYAAVTLEGSRDEQISTLEDLQKYTTNNVLEIQVGGGLITTHQATEQVEKDLIKAELISLPILGLLLLFFFRSPIAAILPVILGIISIIGGLGIVRALTNFVEIDQYAINVITVLGLGLAVDYSLLMVNRFKEELQHQSDITTALRRTVLTSGRTIFFSGITVTTCLLILSLFPISFLRSVGLGGASALLVAIIAALVVLPALLSLVGHNINKWSFGRKKSEDKEEHSIWIKTGAFTLKHPVLTLLVSGLVILTIAAPFRHVNFINLDYRSLAPSSSSYKVAESLTNDFSGQSPSINVVYELEDPAQNLAEVASLTRKISDLKAVESVESPTPIAQLDAEVDMMYDASQPPPTPDLFALQQRYLGEDVVLLNVHPKPNISDNDEQELIEQIRQLTLNKGEVKVGGQAAIMNDTLDIIGQYLPFAIGAMAIIIFILFVLLLQSIVIPLKTIFINAFTLLAAFGILTLIFQDGWLTEQTWLSQTGGMQPTIPILIFAVAFGLSMDYAAFLYGRMHEEYDKTKDNDRAVLTALDKTGSIITAAAILLFVVVSAFATSQIAIIQQVGVGLAVAVILDAFVIRMFLVPAIMRLLGHINWYAPAWIKRWHIKHE